VEELGGQPTTEAAAKSIKGQNVEAIFPFDSNLEDNTIVTYNDFIKVCRENGDSSSVKLFELIIEEEQIHFNYFDNVSEHIKNLDGTYLAQIAGTSSATGLQTQGFAARQGGAPQAGA
jgi:bacterioferritin